MNSYEETSNTDTADIGFLKDYTNSAAIMNHTVNVVSSYLSRNKVDANEVIGLMKNVYNSVASMERLINLKFSNLEPAVPINESIHQDYIVCLEVGRKLKVLKKHLRTAYNMTPEEYRAKWKLPSNYPMVAPKYANQRSVLARSIGLGKKKRK